MRVFRGANPRTGSSVRSAPAPADPLLHPRERKGRSERRRPTTPFSADGGLTSRLETGTSASRRPLAGEPSSGPGGQQGAGAPQADRRHTHLQSYSVPQAARPRPVPHRRRHVDDQWDSKDASQQLRVHSGSLSPGPWGPACGRRRCVPGADTAPLPARPGPVFSPLKTARLLGPSSLDWQVTPFVDAWRASHPPAAVRPITVSFLLLPLPGGLDKSKKGEPTQFADPHTALYPARTWWSRQNASLARGSLCHCRKGSPQSLPPSDSQPP